MTETVAALNIVAYMNVTINLNMLYRLALVKIADDNISKGDILAIYYGDYQRGVVRVRLKKKQRIEMVLELPFESSSQTKRDTPGKVSIPECTMQEKNFRAFANCVSLVIASGTRSEHGNHRTNGHKVYNVKVYENGCLQITGCKQVEQCVEAIRMLLMSLKKIDYVLDQVKNEKIVDRTSVEINGFYSLELMPSDFQKKLFIVRQMTMNSFVLDQMNVNVDLKTVEKERSQRFQTDCKNIIHAVFNIAMKNHTFTLNEFENTGIDRTKLHMFVNEHSEELGCDSYYNNAKHSGVNVKFPCDYSRLIYEVYSFDLRGEDDNFPCDISQLVHRNIVSAETYYTLLAPQGTKKLNKQKRHTFIVFASGRIIQSGGGMNMDEANKKFRNMMTEIKNHIV